MIAHSFQRYKCRPHYVLSEAGVAESGKHEELIEQGGIYSRMWNEYNRSVSWQVRKAGV